jgi:hypothetical protein
MAGSFEVEWLPGGLLLQRRQGVFTVEEARAYVAAVETAVASAPAVWGAVIDTRTAGAQTEPVQAVIQDLIQFVNAKGVKRVAFVRGSAVNGMQQRRVATGPGMHDRSTVSFHVDFDEAVADLRSALTL